MTEKVSIRIARGILAAALMLGLSVGCAPMSKNVNGVDSTNVIANKDATTESDHYALAKRFEDAAREMEAKAEEQKKLLEQYEKEHLYGWQAGNLKSRTVALIRKYEEAARLNMKEATSHRQMAQKLERNYVKHGSL